MGYGIMSILAPISGWMTIPFYGKITHVYSLTMAHMGTSTTPMYLTNKMVLEATRD